MVITIGFINKKNQSQYLWHIHNFLPKFVYHFQTHVQVVIFHISVPSEYQKALYLIKVERSGNVERPVGSRDIHDEPRQHVQRRYLSHWPITDQHHRPITDHRRQVVITAASCDAKSLHKAVI